MRVIRQGGSAIHFIPEAIPEATEVDLVVDWSRRFDHMQQHSGTFVLLNVYYDLVGFCHVLYI